MDYPTEPPKTIQRFDHIDQYIESGQARCFIHPGFAVTADGRLWDFMAGKWVRPIRRKTHDNWYFKVLPPRREKMTSKAIVPMLKAAGFLPFLPPTHPDASPSITLDKLGSSDVVKVATSAQTIRETRRTPVGEFYSVIVKYFITGRVQPVPGAEDYFVTDDGRIWSESSSRWKSPCAGDGWSVDLFKGGKTRRSIVSIMRDVGFTPVDYKDHPDAHLDERVREMVTKDAAAPEHSKKRRRV